jgi:predicted Zn finger-like uncharacterized protein
MIVTCPECDAKYRVSEAALQQRAGRVKCANCSHVWTVDDEALPLTQPIEDTTGAPETQPEAPEEVAAQAEPEPTLESKPHAAVRRREEEKKLKSRVAVERAGWAGIAACFLVLMGSAYLLRVDIVDTWPHSAGAYAALGMDINPTGLVVEELTANLTQSPAGRVLQIQGKVRNITDREQAVPTLVAQVLNAEQDVLAQWSLSINSLALDGGGSEAFSAEISGAPEGGARVDVILGEGLDLTNIPQASLAQPSPGISQTAETTGDAGAHH